MSLHAKVKGEVEESWERGWFPTFSLFSQLPSSSVRELLVRLSRSVQMLYVMIESCLM
uniref:Uncharacterized protein n=1 Tax=Cucumis melo TaxID=3656 RepID=A0A9I9ED18_CUCME